MALTDVQAAVLQAVADAIAESLHGGDPLSNDALAEAFREAILAENADAGDEAEARCRALRDHLAEELRRALAAAPETAYLLQQRPGLPSVPPSVRVEIRGTAGRSVLGNAFAVGNAAECEVQAVGDPTVKPVQCIVVPLPRGIVVADLWSGGGTRITWARSIGEPASPISAPAQRAAFIVPHGERVVLRIGARTTITLGPSAKKMSKLTRKEALAGAAAKAAAATTARKDMAIVVPKPPSPPGQQKKLSSSRAGSSQASTSFESLFTRCHSGSSSRSRSPSHRVQQLQGGCDM
mmetsp:Transcript_19406/g.51845  ORF Transcript_19406/g.51845 Transcript_19406/m.51845 type:complete len:294 (-) Transcript_19406:642-1523(-)